MLLLVIGVKGGFFAGRSIPAERVQIRSYPESVDPGCRVAR